MLKLAVTIDVEEEGLFSGQYKTLECSAKNLAYLNKLDPLFREYNIRPTLMVAYQVAKEKRNGELIMEFSERWGAEVAAHLHHWNTPPIIELPHRDPAPSDLIPRDILREKLANLNNAIQDWAPEPKSFRMGRFNLGPSMLQLLHETSIIVDSSVAPLRRQYGGPNHIDAPSDPYYPDLYDPSLPGDSSILEVPMTIVPLINDMGKWLGRLDRAGYSGGSWREFLAEKIVSIPAQPMWTGLRRMKLATALHERRGGRVVNTFFHSSELMPMGNPKHPTEVEIDAFIKKLGAFFRWLAEKYGYEAVTLAELKRDYPSEVKSDRSINKGGDCSQLVADSTAKPGEDTLKMPTRGPFRIDPRVDPGRAPVKLIILIQDMEFGGTQRYVGYLLQNMDRNIFQPELWLLRGGDELLPFATKVCAPVVTMCGKMWVTPMAIVRLFLKMRKARPDIVYTITGAPNGWGRVFAKALGVPVIIGGYRSMIPQPFEKWFWKLSDRIICNAQTSKKILVNDYHVDPEIITVIPNAVDTDFFRPEPASRAEAPTIVSVSRLVREKDPLTLLKAMIILRNQLPGAKLDMVGGGYLENEVRQFLHKNDLEGNVKLHLSQSDVLSFLHKGWVFAISSQQESSPNSVLEAMSAGLPVVGTKVGGIPEIVRDGETGIIVPPKDPEALAHAILDLLQDPVKRTTMGENARKTTLESHSPTVMAKATEMVFKNCMHRSASKAGLT